MPLKISINLDAGHGGELLSEIWVARKEPLSHTKEEYLYQLSHSIHPWNSIGEFVHRRGEGHVMLTVKALLAFDQLPKSLKSLPQNCSKNSNHQTPLGDEQRLKEYRVMRQELSLTPDEFL